MNFTVSHIVVALIHLCGVIGYQFTLIPWFLLLPALHAFYQTILFVLAAAYLLSLTNEEKFKQEYENVGIRFIIQLTVLITSYQIYIFGYEFISGIMFITAITFILMLMFIKNHETEN